MFGGPCSFCYLAHTPEIPEMNLYQFIDKGAIKGENPRNTTYTVAGNFEFANARARTEQASGSFTGSVCFKEEQK